MTFKLAIRWAVTPLLFAAATTAQPAEPAKIDVFTGGEEGYHTFRIPALAITGQGTALAFCEGRKESPSDQGDIDLVLKRSTDGGVTWGPLSVVHEEGGDAPITIGNPAPVVARDNTIHLLFTRNNKRLFQTRSADDGRTWSAPEEQTHILKNVDFPWLRIASGPVHGIQLRSGRLLVPMWYCDAEPHAKSKRYRAGALYSDDHGATWHAGAPVPETIPRLNECTVIERTDGTLLLNMRVYKAGYRALAESTDDGATWSEPRLNHDLPDATCQGSMLRLNQNLVLFSNVPGPERENLTLRVSQDQGATWPIRRTLEAGPSGYSDLATCADGTILCLYERGQNRYNEKITAARIDTAWLSQQAG